MEGRDDPGARRDLKRLDRTTQGRILAALKKLGNDPFAAGADVKKMTGSSAYRLRVGDYRVVYEVRQREVLVTVIEIGHRRDVYR